MNQEIFEKIEELLVLRDALKDEVYCKMRGRGVDPEDCPQAFFPSSQKKERKEYRKVLSYMNAKLYEREMMDLLQSTKERLERQSNYLGLFYSLQGALEVADSVLGEIAENLEECVVSEEGKEKAIYEPWTHGLNSDLQVEITVYAEEGTTKILVAEKDVERMQSAIDLRPAINEYQREKEKAV